MRLVSVTFVRNEADILETFVRYHAQLFDRMILVNHRSVDASVEIMRRLKAEGLPLELEEEESVEFQLGRFMTPRLVAAVERHGADWVMPIDPDEFLTAERGTVRAAIERLRPDSVAKVPWRTYVPLPSADLSDRNVLTRIQHHRAKEGDQFHKILVPRGLVLEPDTLVGAGSHTFVRPGKLVPEELPHRPADDLVLAHFPLRSTRQLMTKVLLGWLVILSKPNRERTESFHMKVLYDRIMKGGDVTPEDLTDLARNYSRKVPFDAAKDDFVLRPIRPEGGDVSPRYELSEGADPLLILMQVAEEQAAALAEARRRADEGTIGLETLRGMIRRSRLSDVARAAGTVRNMLHQLRKGS